MIYVREILNLNLITGFFLFALLTRLKQEGKNIYPSQSLKTKVKDPGLNLGLNSFPLFGFHGLLGIWV